MKHIVAKSIGNHQIGSQKTTIPLTIILIGDKRSLYLILKFLWNSKLIKCMSNAIIAIQVREAFEAEQAKQAGEAARFGAGYNPYHLVCCQPDGTPIISGILQHHFHEVLCSCGFPSIRFHDLRHTNATLMLRHNVPTKIVSSMLGHSSIGITMDTYSHVMTDMQAGAVGVMDSLLK